ncbi:MAG: cysteine-rich CWC family protein [Leptothrix sp. (in: b-proteobacteria)]
MSNCCSGNADSLPTSGAQPLAAHRCPLCGGPNGCAPAQAGRFDVACWCTTTRIPAEVLARIPAEQRGLACVCQRCASGQPPA